MVIELSLLSGVLLLFSAFGLTNVPLILFALVVVGISVPVIRLVRMRAPPFVPTPQKIVSTMLQLAAIRSGEIVVDVGCGDGRLVIAAAKLGAHAVGYELSVPTWILATLRARHTPNAHIFCRNFWTQSFADTDVILCYLLPSAMERLEREIWPQLKPGCRIVSHAFKLPSIPPKEQREGVILYVK